MFIRQKGELANNGVEYVITKSFVQDKLEKFGIKSLFVEICQVTT